MDKGGGGGVIWEELGIWTKWRIWMGAVMKDIDGVGRYGIACEMWG